MKYFLFVFGLFLTSFAAQAQSPVSTKKHKVVFQLTSADTIAHKNLVRQLENLKAAAPNAKIEVVCHNDGIQFLRTAVTKQTEKISELSLAGIDFVACENTMKQRKISREELTISCRTVQAGILEIMTKQEKKWSYIKAGN
jgi:intracellular sulfur oxidation DsrE/DsrF family protein